MSSNISTAMSEVATTKSDIRKTGIVAALEREVKPLVRNWTRRTIEHAGRRYRLYENGNAALIWGGIGSEAARRATEALIGQIHPAKVVSVGFAGALDGSMQVGDVLTPAVVINAADGSRTEIPQGKGALVSSATVADKEQKIRLAKAYRAIAVDMEAAAVAQGARAREIEFAAIKVISDGLDFNMPALDHFVAKDGTFQSVRFAAHLAIRPWLWKSTLALARNSSKASRALCNALAVYLEKQSGRNLSGEVSPRKSLRDETLAREFDPNGELDSNDESLKFATAHTSSGLGPHTQVTENTKAK
jgi:adenosylhomocysteine nucleosidase